MAHIEPQTQLPNPIPLDAYRKRRAVTKTQARSHASAVMRARLRELGRYFFVSYARCDASRVYALLEPVARAGCVLWADHLDLRSLGQSPDLADAIDCSRGLILMGSRNAYASPNVFREVALAGRLGKPIMAIAMDEAAAPDTLSFYLPKQQFLSTSDPNWRSRLRTELQRLAPVKVNILRSWKRWLAKARRGVREVRRELVRAAQRKPRPAAARSEPNPLL